MRTFFALFLLIGFCYVGHAEEVISAEDSDNVRTLIQVMDDYYAVDPTTDRYDEMKVRLGEFVTQMRLFYQAQDAKASDICQEAATRVGVDYEEAKEKLLGLK